MLFDEEGDSSGPDYELFLRRTDGSPAVLLGRGAPTALSPDGKWVATVLRSPQPHVALLRTGPGEARSLPAHGDDAVRDGGREVSRPNGLALLRPVPGSATEGR